MQADIKHSIDWKKDGELSTNNTVIKATGDKDKRSELGLL